MQSKYKSMPGKLLTAAPAILVAVLGVIGTSACSTVVPQARVSPAEAATAEYLRRISQVDDSGPTLNAVLSINPQALKQARGNPVLYGPLAGRALLIKDNIETADPLPTTAGSLALKDNFTGRDAPVVAKLRAAGAVILGKANLSEWANFRASDSSSGWSALGGQTRNPHATDRSPCGSSSGSAVAVAAGLAWAAIGTETDGSITCPASVNGVVGLKPTVGLVSRTHIVPISRAQDTAGPLASSVRDAALLLTAMAGSDPLDPATRRADEHLTDYAQRLDFAQLQGVRIGVLTRQADGHPGVSALFRTALDDLTRAGAQLVDIAYEPSPDLGRDEYTALVYEQRVDLNRYLKSLPGQPAVRSMNDVIAFNRAHAASELRWFGQDIFELSAKSTDETEASKARANATRLAGRDGIDALLARHRVTLLVTPTSGPAWPIDLLTGDHFLDIGAGSLAAVAGYPHLTVPMGAVGGLPVGLSFIGPAWSERKLLEAGAAYERVRSATVPVPQFKRWGD